MEGREGEGISRGTGCQPCLLSSPFRNVKRRQDGDTGAGEGGQVTGTGTGLRDLVAGSGWIRALAQASRVGQGIGPSTPTFTQCPTNQMTSIPEVILPGGGSGKVTFPFLSSSCLTATKPTLSFLPAYFNK